MSKSIITDIVNVKTIIKSEILTQREMVATINLRLQNDPKMCDVKIGEYFFQENESVEIIFEIRPRWLMQNSLSKLHDFIWGLV